MSDRRNAIGVASRAAVIFLAALLLSTAPWAGAFALTRESATAAHSASGTAETTPPQIRQLLILLADPQVRSWLAREGKIAAAHEPTMNAPAHSLSEYLDSRVGTIRRHIVALAAALPGLPAQLAQAAGRVTASLGRHGRVKVRLLIAAFVVLGYGVEWLFRRMTGRLRALLDRLPVETVDNRLRIVAMRFVFAVGVVAAFALGSIGAFLVFDWPPLLSQMVFDYLLVFLAVRMAIVIGHFLLSPRYERFRIIPMEQAAARFWCRRLAIFAGLFAFGWVEFGLLAALGLSLQARQIVVYALGFGLLAIALEAVWRRPLASEAVATAPAHAAPRLGRAGQNALLSLAIVLCWALWVVQTMPVFWLVMVALALPLAMGVTCSAVQHILRPPGSQDIETASPNIVVPSVVAVVFERGMRALLFITAAAILAWGWGIDLTHLAAGDNTVTRLVHGVLSAVIILLVADVLWHALKTAIDRKLVGAVVPGHPNSEEARRQARLRTLLPIFRNILLVAVFSVAALMALAALGVQIEPLVAGAGVVGVAVGFGAQSFVRDVIAGILYLLDDAFRVGEYIQAGHYKGTVEGFSIRSVRLRHQRGPVFTVPFSLLGAVENMSRDWVIDKLSVGVTYDSDIELARKLIKRIGLELAEDPEFAPLILQPLKMQGVEEFGDFAVQLRMKMMTLPGEQFVIRRKAYVMIKKAFDENGIKFAFPTVQIASDSEAATAAAYRGLQLTQPTAAK